MQDNYKLKPNCELELSLLLQNKFVDKISSVVGRDFEDLICKYFEGNFLQTNVNAVESAFSDVRQDDTYFSIKYSQAVKDKTLATVTGDNFRTTTIAKMISQSVLMSEGKYTHELGQIKSRKELDEFMKDKTITSNKFGIIAGYSWIDNLHNRGIFVDDALCKDVNLKISFSNILTGQELYKRLLQVYDEFDDMKKELRSLTITRIFGKGGEQIFRLPIGDSNIANIKEYVQKNIMDTIFETPESLIDKLRNIPEDIIKKRMLNETN